MEDLQKDPIIIFYMRMSSSTEKETELPVFSETMLRLSFKEICGPLRLPMSGDLQLYRKLLLLRYSEKYPSITDLMKIMSCFDEAEILDYFDSYMEIIEQWRTFLRLNLNNVIYREAFNEILFEYTRRYLSLFGAINDNMLMEKADEVQQFLRDDEKLPKQWNRAFHAVFNHRVRQAKCKQYENITMEHLEVVNIYQDIKKSLNFLVVEAMEFKIKSKDFGEPQKKKMGLNMVTDENCTVTNAAAADVCEINDDESISNATDVNVSEKINLKTNDDESQEILEQVVLVNSDLENEESENEESNEFNDFIDDDNSEQGDNIENSKSNEVEDLEFQRIVNDDAAMGYLAALQAYAVVNGHFEAIGLLDKVDSLFRQKLARK